MRVCCGVCVSENSVWDINCCSFNATLMVAVCLYKHSIVMYLFSTSHSIIHYIHKQHMNYVHMYIASAHMLHALSFPPIAAPRPPFSPPPPGSVPDVRWRRTPSVLAHHFHSTADLVQVRQHQSHANSQIHSPSNHMDPLPFQYTGPLPIHKSIT